MNRTTPFIPVGAHNASAPADYSAARTLTPPATATKLRIQCATQNVRYRLDGGVPTSTVGFQLKAGDAPIEISLVSGVAVVKVIEETGTAVVQFQWGR